jgi:hypothetical protein
MQICDPSGKVIANIQETTQDSGAEAAVCGMQVQEVLRQLGLSEQDLSHCPFDLVMAEKIDSFSCSGGKGNLRQVPRRDGNRNYFIKPG